MGAVSKVFIVGVLSVLTLVIRDVHGLIYPISEAVGRGTAFLKPLNSQPMYSKNESPFWFGGYHDPIIGFSGNMSFNETQSEMIDYIRLIVAWNDEKADDETAPILKCNMNESDFSTVLAPYTLYDSQIVQTQNFSVASQVNKTGWYLVYMIKCVDDDMELDARLEYLNPFGYLSGWAFGLLPMNLVLVMAYILLTCWYIFRTFQNRQNVLALQYAIIGVLLMGLFERLTWFLTFLDMNTGGIPSCCPIRKDLMLGIGLTVFKQSSSALLLLIVSLGFGIVRPTLPSFTIFKVIALGIGYTFASLNYEMAKMKDVSENGHQTQPFYFLSLISTSCLFAIIMWIYFAITDISRDLREAKQIAKLGMYQTLARSLTIWISAWLVLSLTQLFLFRNPTDFSWKHWWIFTSFWDIFFFGLLCQICYIWSPSPLTSQYAYSYELPTSEDLGEFGEAGLELQLPETMQNDFVIGGDSDSDDSDISIDRTPPSSRKKERMD